MRMVTGIISCLCGFMKKAKTVSCVAFLIGAMANVASAIETTSFSPIFVKNAAGVLQPLTWTYAINQGQPLTVESEGISATCKFGDLKLTVNPTTKIREGSFAVAITGGAKGSATAKFTETLAALTDRVGITNQKVNIGLSVSSSGVSVSVLIAMLTQFSPSAEWFLDRSDLDLLGIGYQWDGEVSGTTTGSVKTTVGGYVNPTETINTEGTVPDSWAIVDLLESYEAGGKTYENVVVVERYTEVPTGNLSGASMTDATITYWVAQGVGMIKGVGQYQFMNTPLEIELKSATLLQTQALTFPAILSKEIGAVFDPVAKASSLLAVTYESSDETVAVVNGEGLIETVGAGTAVITASQSGNNNFFAAKPVSKILVVKANVSAEIDPVACGTVAGTGLYTLGQKVTLTAKPAKNYMFLNWEDACQAPIRTLCAGAQNQTVKAYFGLIADAVVPAVENPGPQVAMVGVAYEFALPITSACLPTVTMIGLPPGLRYDAGTVKIVGVPSKPGSYNVSFKASNVKGVAATQTFTMTIAPLPVWAQGTFNGVAESDVFGTGVASMSVTPLGKMTGKLSLAGTNYSFSAGSFMRDVDVEGVLVLACTAAVGKVSIPLSLHTSLTSFDGALEGVTPGALGVALNMSASGDFGGTEGVPAVSLYRNVWKDTDMVAVATNYTGYYTATLPGGPDYGSGYLAFTVDKLGSIKTAGKLADGTAVSLSGALIVDTMGRVSTVLYTAPAAYKGGAFFGAAEFRRSDSGVMVVSPNQDLPFIWCSFNPLATGEYGMGMTRELSIVGGYYDKLTNLRDYYKNGLTVGYVDILPPLLATVRFTDIDSDSLSETPPKITWTESTEASSADVSPSGLVLGVTPATGDGTGLSAPATKPPLRVIDPDTGDVWYDYEVSENQSGLTIAFTRATGLFTGGFNVYYDYVSAMDYTTGKQAWEHKVKRALYEGVLTPVRAEGEADGRGFFLWADNGSYDSGRVNANGEPIMTAFPFSRSYDFQLLMP